jgi:hypothetical protein
VSDCNLPLLTYPVQIETRFCVNEVDGKVVLKPLSWRLWEAMRSETARSFELLFDWMALFHNGFF